jgi:N-acetylglucosamine-6-phosphate deacetylase
MISPGWVEVADERILAWGSGHLESTPDLCTEILSPGFVDVHCHGGGGASFGSNSDQTSTAIETHLRNGTTTLVASLVTATIPDLEDQVRTLARFVNDGLLAGIHLEGPWLSQKYKGAHAEKLLIPPIIQDITRLIEASEGTISMVTIAPELPGAIEAIGFMSGQGILAAIGHTAADFDTAQAGIEAGARGATHLFNAMSEIHHREPGPALALWMDDRVYVELICDGVHVHPDLIAHVMSVSPAKVVLITDAMAACGCTDGDYTLGDLPVEVRAGVARIAGTSTIAGSTLTLDKAVRTAVKAGVEVETALKAATCNPADYLGLNVGRIEVGSWADLVCLDAELLPTRVMRHGQWVG